MPATDDWCNLQLQCNFDHQWRKLEITFQSQLKQIMPCGTQCNYTGQNLLRWLCVWKPNLKPVVAHQPAKSTNTCTKGWDLVEWLERCASIPMITSSNPSGGSEFTFRSDLLLTARGGSTWALLVEFACLPCYPGNTLCSQHLEPPGRAGISAIQIPQFFFYFYFYFLPLKQNTY
jgi:hypothetical protein